MEIKNIFLAFMLLLLVNAGMCYSVSENSMVPGRTLGLHYFQEKTNDVQLKDSLSIPLIEIPALKTINDMPLMICISGDGGWKEFINELCNNFAGKGIPVVGIDALEYFRNYVPPEKVASDVTKLIEIYSKKWHKSKVILLGYSFGASVIPFVANRISGNVKKSVSLVAMLSPDRYADFEFHLSDWFNKSSKDALPVLPEIKEMKQIRSILIIGEKEDDAFINDIPPGFTKIIKIPGGHHYDHNLKNVVSPILKSY